MITSCLDQVVLTIRCYPEAAVGCRHPNVTQIPLAAVQGFGSVYTIESF